MKTIPDLSSGCEIRVRGILGRITIETLQNFCSDKGTGSISQCVARDIEQKRPTQYAWTNQAPAMLTADCAGKAEALARQKLITEAAPYVETDDVLIIDGVPYRARVRGNYSDPVALDRFVCIHPDELADAVKVIREYAETGKSMVLDALADELEAALKNKN